MKKFIPLLLFAFFSTSLFAQLQNTTWMGTIRGDNPRNVLLIFKHDSAIVYTISDNQLVEEMTCVFTPSTFTVKKVEGQSDCDNNTPGKYDYLIKGDRMTIKLAEDACSDRSTALDTTKWRRWKDHKEVKVSENILKKYVGVYEFNPAHLLTITLENGILYIEGPNNNLPKTPLMPESDTRFFLKIAGVELDFVLDSSGKVEKCVSHEDMDYELKKIK